jgi:hypothetical protein
MPILFPTRPLTAADISSIANTKSADIRFIKESLNTVRGTIYPISHDLPSDQEGACEQGMLDGDDDYDAMQAKSVVSVGRLASVSQVKIAVTSLKTDSKSWCAAAGRKPDCSAKRFNRIVDLCNSILKASRDGRPDYVLFPELSIPSRWIRTIAETFLKSGISVVAGEEYEHHQGDGSVVDSPARLYLKDDRLGYPTWFILTQLKGKPAHGERDELRSMFGLALRPSQEELSKKFIFSHNGFRFGVLICSELTDVKFREHFRGQVDALFILSWNRDLESFSALVDSTALDVHCFVALVNNRAYGDSRVRVPHKDAWCRDAVRVKGGLTDYFVVAELDVLALRNFQSHLEPPKGPFKPFPEGFDVPDARRVVPGTLS